jgi:hypothetical protein
VHRITLTILNIRKLFLVSTSKNAKNQIFFSETKSQTFALENFLIDQIAVPDLDQGIIVILISK